MPFKRPISTTSGKEPKCHKKIIILHEKVQLLDMIKEGKSYAAVGCHYGVNESTMHYTASDSQVMGPLLGSFMAILKCCAISTYKTLFITMKKKTTEPVANNQVTKEGIKNVKPSHTQRKYNNIF